MNTHLFVFSFVPGSSKASSISACLKNTLPLQARHNNLSKLMILSRVITPATNLFKIKAFSPQELVNRRIITHVHGIIRRVMIQIQYPFLLDLTVWKIVVTMQSYGKNNCSI